MVKVPVLPSCNSPSGSTKLDICKDDKVLDKRTDSEYDAHENPEDEGTDAIRFRDCSRDAVIHVDQHQEDGEEETESARDCLSADSKADPTGANHEDTRSEVEPDIRIIFSG